MKRISKLLQLGLFLALFLGLLPSELEAQNTGRYVWGLVFSDADDNCEHDNNELGLEGWTVRATETTTQDVMETSTGNGYYEFFFDGPAEYEISLVPPVGLTATGACLDSYTIDVPSDTLIIDSIGLVTNFPIASVTSECPQYMTVDVGGWRMRRCFDNDFNIQYCNYGLEDEDDVYVEVTIDDFLSLTDSSIPVSSQDGNTYTFEIGSVPSGQCGSFSITALVSCDAELGQTHCIEAHFFPDTNCIPVDPLWSGASLEVEGVCTGDEVEFTITNAGDGDMQDPVDFIVVEDHVVMMQGQVPALLIGEEFTVTEGATGATFRLEVDQVANHPAYSLQESATVEACTEGDEFSVGFVTQLSGNDDEPYLSELCMENRDSYDPNEKNAYPKGFGEEHFIEANTQLEYVIHFQNTGTDTAYTVIIEDQISDYLNPASLRPGASSHNYEFTMTAEGKAIFTFNDIMLPDSNVNQVASNGYVNFTINQVRDLPIGTIINNEAAIFFDFNDPIITNQTFHQIGEDFIDVEITSVNPEFEGMKFNIGPNPFRSQTTFYVEGINDAPIQIKLFDLHGKQILSDEFQSNTYELNRAHLANGTYLFRLESNGQWMASGKLMVQ